MEARIYKVQFIDNKNCVHPELYRNRFRMSKCEEFLGRTHKQTINIQCLLKWFCNKLQRQIISYCKKKKQEIYNIPIFGISPNNLIFMTFKRV